MTEENWAKLALDVSSYSEHDEDCDAYTGKGKCSCGYTATMDRMLRCAQSVVDRAKEGARA